jgi:hypothetical protein
MKTRFLLAGLLLPAPRPAQAAAGLELYGNIETMGITITLASGDDPDQDAAAGVEYRIHGAEAYRPGFPLSRVSDTRFVGSLFRLVPGLWHTIPITISGGGTSYSTSVGLLVGGTHTYLPLVLKN